MLVWLWAVGVVMTLGGFVVQPRDQAPLFFVIGLAFLVIAFVITKKRMDRQKYIAKAKEELEKADCVDVKDDGDTITLHRRSLDFAQYITVEQYKYRETDYHDAELVYTGVTNGGIHMGGFHVNPEHATLGNWVQTNKYDLCLNPYYKTIRSIRLVGSALEDARKDSFISGFLKGDTLELRHDVDTSFHMAGASMGSAAIDKKRNSLVMANIIVASKLTKAECERVLRWLQGDAVKGVVATGVDESVSVGLVVLAVLYPLFGIIYWPVKAKTRPKCARACGIAAIISLIVSYVIGVIAAQMILNGM